MPAAPSCSLCGQPATYRCSSCCRVYYCKEEHQSEDWPRHKPECRACEVFLSPELGYCLKATRDITRGEVIIKENPFIIGPSCFTELPCCVGCSSGLPMEAGTILSTCPECEWLVCSPNCPKLSDPTGHVIECAMLKWMQRKICALLLPLRCMLLQKSNPKLWKWLMNLSSKAIDKVADKSLHDDDALLLETISDTIFQENRSFLPLDYSAVTFNNIYAVLDAYGLDFRTLPIKSELTGLYKIAGFLHLSCVANTRTDFCYLPLTASQQRYGRVVVTALRDIRKGEILSSPYAMSFSSTYFRQADFASRNLVCRCPRCLDPRELGLDFGTMKCLSCPGWLLPVDTSNILTCDWACARKCGVTVTVDVVFERIIYFFRMYQSLGPNHSDVSLNPETLEGLLADFLSALHPNHFLCLLIRRLLLKAYCISNVNVGCRLRDEQLERQAVLCREILNSIDRLGTHIYRGEEFVVCTLKDYAETQFELTRRKYMFADWSTERASSNLVHGLILLVNALKILHTTRLDLRMISSIQATRSAITRWAQSINSKIPSNTDLNIERL